MTMKTFFSKDLTGKLKFVYCIQRISSLYNKLKHNIQYDINIDSLQHAIKRRLQVKHFVSRES